MEYKRGQLFYLMDIYPVRIVGVYNKKYIIHYKTNNKFGFVSEYNINKYFKRG